MRRKKERRSACFPRQMFFLLVAPLLPLIVLCYRCRKPLATCPQTTFTFFYHTVSISLVSSFLLFFLAASLSSFLRFFNHLFPYLFSAYAAILLHEISAARIFPDFEVRTFRDTVLKFRAFPKTFYFESL